MIGQLRPQLTDVMARNTRPEEAMRGAALPGMGHVLSHVGARVLRHTMASVALRNFRALITGPRT